MLRSSKDNKLYIGSTRDLKNRIKLHNAGKVKSTKSRKPFELLHSEEYETIIEVRKGENFLKTGHGREWLKNEIVAWKGGRVV
ncbi:MAG: GIY-YIG nuclease family protein [Candidatus Omnitrophica bacterium]|nr:GIY-YIG nuclease family protein [Candidatus Omnitrophota bacterium]